MQWLLIAGAVYLAFRLLKEREPGEIGGAGDSPFLETRKGVQITQDFNSSEFLCRCGRCQFLGIDRRLVAGLQFLRNALRTPVHINSGYRCPAHNAAINGAKNSYHMRGMAADISCSANIRDVASLAEAMRYWGGIGRYDDKNFVHLDVGASGRRFPRPYYNEIHNAA